MLNYPIAIFKDEGMDNYAAIVPDIDGCFPLGDTIDDTIQEAESLIYDHIEYMLDKGMSFDFHTSEIESLKTNPDFKDTLVWAIVSIDDTKFSTKQVRFNVSWPEYLLKRVDHYAEANHETRSGFLAKAVQKVLV
ncbi:type II toxin-antitoxin system HicB family antitoxin [Psychrobacter jeotgali]|uniref:type II toxin-antitoxin system HicB family antitoxin n=1 Tax=Psychrobacter jeotgali TaxID=179010 RepID=UPI00191A52A0|nr:type II toxin-antitoxin system HicB family antitoxin [Psychrobacter jeotgali]